RGPERHPVEHAAQDADGVRFLPLAREKALAGAPAVEVRLDVGLGERQARRAAVADGLGRSAGRPPPPPPPGRLPERVPQCPGLLALAVERRIRIALPTDGAWVGLVLRRPGAS